MFCERGALRNFAKFTEKHLYQSLGKKLKFCEAAKSYISAIYEKILSMFVKCLCGWNCMSLYSFFSHPLLYLMTKINLLNKTLFSFNPANSCFSVNNLQLVKQLPLNLIDASQYFFHYQLETNKRHRPQSNFLKNSPGNAWFRGEFLLYLIRQL